MTIRVVISRIATKMVLIESPIELPMYPRFVGDGKKQYGFIKAISGRFLDQIMRDVIKSAPRSIEKVSIIKMIHCGIVREKWLDTRNHPLRIQRREAIDELKKGGKQ